MIRAPAAAAGRAGELRIRVDDATYAAYNKVAGIVVTGNEDGADHVWTYWNVGPGPGPSYTETAQGNEWSDSTAG